MDKKRVLVAGAAGKMGKEVIKLLTSLPNYPLASALDVNHTGIDSGIVAGLPQNGIPVTNSIDEALAKKPDVLIDFTRHEAAMLHIKAAAAKKVASIVGTTGFTGEEYEAMNQWSKEYDTAILVAPNFSIGAVLMMRFAEEAAKHFSWAEIIELHHEKKADAPSGTALRTALLMQGKREQFNTRLNEENHPSRGLNSKGIHLHSVRLPGLLAHQEVLLGSTGELLTIRHDSTSRESFMSGIRLALEKVHTIKGLVIGLESIMD